MTRAWNEDKEILRSVFHDIEDIDIVMEIITPR